MSEHWESPERGVQEEGETAMKAVPSGQQENVRMWSSRSPEASEGGGGQLSAWIGLLLCYGLTAQIIDSWLRNQI